MAVEVAAEVYECDVQPRCLSFNVVYYGCCHYITHDCHCSSSFLLLLILIMTIIFVISILKLIK